MAKIKDNSDKVLAEANRLIKEKLKIAALLVERTAKMPGYCPSKTGTSRRSIISNWYGAAGTRSISWAENKKKGIKKGKTSIPPQIIKRALIGSNVEYFPFHEMGTKNMPAHASLRRALETNWKKIKRMFGAK